jgi:hypothetical protein
MTARTVVAWVVAAVLGLVLAVAITLAASQLSNQRVGLAGEPLSAGDQLVPRAQPHTVARPSSRPSQSARPAQPSRPSQPSGGEDAEDAGGDD